MEKYHEFVDNGFKNPNKQTFTDYARHFINTYNRLTLTVARYGAPCLIPCFAIPKIIGKITNK